MRIWYENFREGLDGNNNSLDPTWTTQGPDGAVWELDFDGSNGDYAGNEPFLLESESADNGWMIFDADGSNAGLPTAAYSNRKGSLTSPYIDLSNDSNVTLSFEHAYRCTTSIVHYMQHANSQSYILCCSNIFSTISMFFGKLF